MAETHDLISRRAGTDRDGEEYYRPAIADVESPPMSFIIEHLDAVVDPGALPREDGATIGTVKMDGSTVVEWEFEDRYVRQVEGPYDDPSAAAEIGKKAPEGEEGYFITQSVNGETTVHKNDGGPWAQRYAEMTATQQ